MRRQSPTASRSPLYTRGPHTAAIEQESQSLSRLRRQLPLHKGAMGTALRAGASPAAATTGGCGIAPGLPEKYKPQPVKAAPSKADNIRPYKNKIKTNVLVLRGDTQKPGRESGLPLWSRAEAISTTAPVQFRLGRAKEQGGGASPSPTG